MFVTILNNGTVTSSGSQVVDSLSASEVILLVNILNAPTGISPSLTFTIADVDPIDQNTVIGNSITSSPITGISATNIRLKNSVSDTLKVSWTLGGTSATFTGVNVSILGKELSESTALAATLSNVAASTSSVTLLASNANRLGATFQNDSTDILFLKLGSAASTTSYTVRMVGNSYYEIPYSYTGIVTGVWSGTNGACRVSEV